MMGVGNTIWTSGACVARAPRPDSRRRRSEPDWEDFALALMYSSSHAGYPQWQELVLTCRVDKFQQKKNTI